jgi:hypothetical protein
MADTRESGELLAGGAVCQQMRSSSSAGTFIVATFRRSHLLHADDSHSATVLLGPNNLRITAWVSTWRPLISFRRQGVFGVHACLHSAGGRT